MKKILLITSLLFSMTAAFAQNGEIIYVDIEPDTVMLLNSNTQNMIMDLNNDGLNDDLKLYWSPSSGGSTLDIWAMKNNLKFMRVHHNAYMDSTNSYWMNYESLGGHYLDYRYRYKIDDHYYYGWFQLTMIVEDILDENGVWHGYSNVWWGFDRYAFCTIPDTPLPWGVTSLADIDESEASTPLFPNPTIGMLTVTGKDLKQAEVFNTLGQKVLSKEMHGDTGQLDMSALPTGVYFVRITDGSGVLRVEKVVKE